VSLRTSAYSPAPPRIASWSESSLPKFPHARSLGFIFLSFPLPRQNACGPKNQQHTRCAREAVCYNCPPCSTCFGLVRSSGSPLSNASRFAIFESRPSPATRRSETLPSAAAPRPVRSLKIAPVRTLFESPRQNGVAER
jgi:hypothetical protein